MNIFCNIVEYFIGNIQQFCLCFFSQNSNSCLQIRWLDICKQALVKPGTQTFFQLLNFIWWTVAGNNNLLFRFPQRIKCVKKFFLRGFFIGNKLDIINQQYIDGAIFIAKFFSFISQDCVNNLVGKGFRRKIGNFCIWLPHQNMIPDGMHQMGFAKSRAAVNKQRIVYAGRCIAGNIIGNPHTGCMGHAVAVAYHKRIKGIFRV